MRLKITKNVTSSGLVTWYATAEWYGCKANTWSTSRHIASWNAVNHCFYQAINKAWNGEQHA